MEEKKKKKKKDRKKPIWTLCSVFTYITRKLVLRKASNLLLLVMENNFFLLFVFLFNHLKFLYIKFLLTTSGEGGI
jgi:hypothetical protein